MIKITNTVASLFIVLGIFSSCGQDDTVDITPPILDGGEEETPVKKGIFADWETGDWRSGFTGSDGPTASFSIIGVMNSQVVSWSPNPEAGFDASIHGMEVVDLDGSKVLKMWSDGTNRNLKEEKFWDESTPYSNRTEIAWNKSMSYDPGDEVYLTYDFKPSESWNEYTKKWETIITQFKEFSSGPFFEILLSNEGLNANDKLDIFVLGGKPDGTNVRIIEDTQIGEISQNAWTQIKVYVKTSTESDGAIKVWINGGNNGTPTYKYSGRTLLKGNGSYTKIGHYGQIYNLKTSYFDNVHITKEIDTPISDWVNN